MTVDDITRELGYKRRDVRDLVRFIRTRNDDNPNYTLLLGAGCSVTSGVRSAGELIKQWRKEVYQSLRPDYSEAAYNDDMCRQFLSDRESSWYDKRNEYASLFEKRYDLPRQRRMFIEREVAAKVPSLGYAYLARLVKNSFFRTVFTTNFDDLLNEAFHLYSDERPIVCAHDSAISSITVTSKRPKVIKLHGDYLFDDIKSTLRETESLEENIKNKFVEFAKDYGLIVIGYGGSDRSVLDVLFYLLKQEEYLKNGIYYCFRPNDVINEEVRKLLWKDRVYYVVIQGFDEVMAEFNKQLNDDQLPVETSIISSKTNRLIENILSNSRLKESPSTIIKTDLEILREQREDRFLEAMLTSLESSNNDLFKGKSYQNDQSGLKKKNEISLAEKIVMLKLHEKMRKQQYDDVTREAEQLLAKGGNQAFLRDLLTVMAQSQRELGRTKEARETYEKLIDMDGSDTTSQMAVADLTEDSTDQLRIIDELMEKKPFRRALFYRKAKAQIRLFKEGSNYQKRSQQFSDIIDTLDTGVKVAPSMDNPCWRLKFRFLLDEQEDKAKSVLDCQEILDSLEAQNPYDIRVVDLAVDLLIKKKEKEEAIITRIQTAKEEGGDSENDSSFDLLLLSTYGTLNDKEEIQRQMKRIEKHREPDAYYLREKGMLLLQKFDDLTGAIEALKQSLDLQWDQGVLSYLFRYYLYANMFSEAEDILFNKLGTDNDDERIDYFEAKKEYEKALAISREARAKQPSIPKGYVIQETYLLLQMEKYGEAQKVARAYLEPSNFSDSVLVINHELAAKLDGKKVHKERLSRVYDAEDDNFIKAAVCVLNDEKEEAINLILKKIGERYDKKYEFRDWVVFKPLHEDPRFRALYESKPVVA